MSFFDSSEELFANRIKSLKEKASKNNQMSILKFLNLRQQDIVKQIIGKNNDIFLYLDGGYENSEYKKCIISGRELDYPDFGIDLLKIEYNKKYLEPNHRMILGALMALGIKRETFGDIIVNSDGTFIVCSKEMTSFLKQEFRTLSHQPIELTLFNGEINNVDEYEVKKCFVSSLRMDNIISAMYNLSRSDSQNMIDSELIKLNHSICLNKSQMVKESDIISVRGKGRMKVIKINGLSKSNKIIIELGMLK